MSPTDKLAELLHDFKSPLSSIRLAIEFILEGRAGKIDDGVRKLLEDVVERDEKLIDKIQKFENSHG